MQLTAVPTLTLDQADAWVSNRSLLLYQQYLYQQKPFLLKIQCEIFSVINFLATGGVNLLLLKNESDQQQCVYQSHGAAHGYSLKRGQFLGADDQSSLRWPDPSRRPVVRIGQRNFAHFIWNELDGLLSLASQQDSELPVHVVQDHNSVLDVSRVPGIQRCHHSGLSDSPSVRVGSRLVSNRVRQLVLQQFDLSHSQSPSIADQPSAFKLLIGIRGPGKRSIVNEEHFYRRLLRCLSMKYQNIVVYFDALTFQNDYKNHHRDILERQSNCQEIIDRLSVFSDSLGLKHINLNGLYFHDWLGVASSLNFYVTHQGTMQHKIGWFFPDIPGYCLIGHKNAASIARWHADQSEDAVAVQCLPEQFFKIGDLPANSTVERDRICRIRQVHAAVENLMEVISLQRGLIPQN